MNRYANNTDIFNGNRSHSVAHFEHTHPKIHRLDPRDPYLVGPEKRFPGGRKSERGAGGQCDAPDGLTSNGQPLNATIDIRSRPGVANGRSMAGKFDPDPTVALRCFFLKISKWEPFLFLFLCWGSVRMLYNI